MAPFQPDPLASDQLSLTWSSLHCPQKFQPRMLLSVRYLEGKEATTTNPLSSGRQACVLFWGRGSAVRIPQEMLPVHTTGHGKVHLSSFVSPSAGDRNKLRTPVHSPQPQTRRAARLITWQQNEIKAHPCLTAAAGVMLGDESHLPIKGS